MARVVITAPADTDVDALLHYLKRQTGEVIAGRYCQRLEQLFERLGEHPDSGPSREALGRGVRIGMVLPYIVFYRYDEADDVVAILRVLHGNREVTRKLLACRPSL